MELISHQEFGKLRLAQFVTDPGEMATLENWEYMERVWVGEAIGFTQWLRYEEDPEILGSLSLDLIELPDEISQSVFRVLALPLRQGMSYEEIVHLFGKPNCTYTFVKDRKTYEFARGVKWKYLIDCTIHEDIGLLYVTVMAD